MRDPSSSPPGSNPSWQELAACRGQPADDWFAERGQPGAAEATARAKAVCETCPVLVECLVAACQRRERFGLWGGAGASLRRRAKRALERCIHTPTEACGKASCSWCRTLADHRRRLAETPVGEPAVTHGSAASHGRRSTYARGCRDAPCRFAASTAGLALWQVSGVDVAAWWESTVVPGVPVSAWAGLPSGLVDDALRVAQRGAWEQVEHVAAA